MIEFYPQIKSIHVWLVMASGSLFLLRGLLVLAGQPFGNHVALKYLSYTIDTALLTAAFMLMTMLHMYPISHDWLTLKVLLLVVYVVLGVQALRRCRTQAARLGWFAAALATYLTMFGIARAHHPLGWLRWWGWV
ncbi:MAG: SirB2 family protein [Rhodanobacteraceae bacterium]|nr:SirB2 family protein [Rhodanobacteraceae bacterium]